MVALKIEELKDFTRKLFVEEVFDWWMMREAVITTFNMFTIDGRIRKGYFMEQELEEKGIGELSPWKLVRPVCFSLIKGKPAGTNTSKGQTRAVGLGKLIKN